ncbi:hypothetical protein ACVNS2_08210 [Paenibacillus caseinilyticus]|uniref:Uncharacterized protein n=1 Tax=Paenibacillus mucilaginosus K02 TaxID=997761 RepID=I0BE48_9BACL|nr:hypothetical protein [Paenibacillus mucilaginosus]AFH60645.1 hypothetical protein B2K_07915 [Paenibacillus mucilaginosus K02]
MEAVQYVGAVIIIIILLMFYIFIFGRFNLPVIERRATVLEIIIERKNLFTITEKIKFATIDGEVLVLSKEPMFTKTDISSITQGDVGMICYRGDIFISFTRPER